MRKRNRKATKPRKATKKTPKPTHALALPPNFPIIPSDDALVGREFFARVDCRKVPNRKGKIVNRCDTQRVTVVGGATPSADKPKRRQVFAVQKGKRFLVSDAELRRELRRHETSCDRYGDRLRHGQSVPAEAYDDCPSLPQSFAGPIEFDVSEFEAKPNSRYAKRNHHGGYHAPGDPMGVYLPPVTQWKHSTSAYGNLRHQEWRWDHPTLFQRYFIITKIANRRYYVIAGNGPHERESTYPEVTTLAQAFEKARALYAMPKHNVHRAKARTARGAAGAAEKYVVRRQFLNESPEVSSHHRTLKAAQKRAYSLYRTIGNGWRVDVESTDGQRWVWDSYVNRWEPVPLEERGARGAALATGTIALPMPPTSGRAEPGGTYFTARPDEWIGRSVGGDDYSGEIRARAVGIDGRPAHVVGGHVMTRARALAGARREDIRMGIIPAPPSRARAPRVVATVAAESVEEARPMRGLPARAPRSVSPQMVQASRLPSPQFRAPALEEARRGRPSPQFRAPALEEARRGRPSPQFRAPALEEARRRVVAPPAAPRRASDDDLIRAMMEELAAAGIAVKPNRGHSRHGRY